MEASKKNSGKGCLFYVGSAIVCFSMIFATIEIFLNHALKQKIGVLLADVIILMSILGLSNPTRFRPLIRIVSGVCFILYFAYVSYEFVLFVKGEKPFHNGQTNNFANSLIGMVIFGLPFLIIAIRGDLKPRK